MTYNALAILLILKDDLAGVDRQSILKGLKVGQLVHLEALKRSGGHFVICLL